MQAARTGRGRTEIGHGIDRQNTGNERREGPEQQTEYHPLGIPAIDLFSFPYREAQSEQIPAESASGFNKASAQNEGTAKDLRFVRIREP